MDRHMGLRLLSPGERKRIDRRVHGLLLVEVLRRCERRHAPYIRDRRASQGLLGRVAPSGGARQGPIAGYVLQSAAPAGPMCETIYLSISLSLLVRLPRNRGRVNELPGSRGAQLRLAGAVAVTGATLRPLPAALLAALPAARGRIEHGHHIEHGQEALKLHAAVSAWRQAQRHALSLLVRP
eukprot:scaffold86197_cov67-Phaeocystis_antarctica.AAC.6